MDVQACQQARGCGHPGTSVQAGLGSGGLAAAALASENAVAAQMHFLHGAPGGG